MEKNNENDFNILVIDNTYNEFQIEEIWKELNFLTNSDILLSSDKTSSATSAEREILKSNLALFLFEFYSEPWKSPIVKYTSEQIFNQKVIQEYTRLNSLNEFFARTNSHSTLLSYYENDGKYEFHRDRSLYTSVTYLFKEPKSFSGGEITFRNNEQYKTFDIKNNMSIIFPSFYEHAVSPVSMSIDSSGFSTMGRYCITQFVYMEAGK